MRCVCSVLLVMIILSVLTLGFSQTQTEAPTISKSELESRLEVLKQGLEQAKASVHAYEGAIADCQYWLDQLGKKVQTDPTEPKQAEPKK